MPASRRPLAPLTFWPNLNMQINWIGMCTRCHTVEFRHLSNTGQPYTVRSDGSAEKRDRINWSGPYFEVCPRKRYTHDRWMSKPCGGMIQKVRDHEAALSAYTFGGEDAVRLMYPVIAPR